MSPQWHFYDMLCNWTRRKIKADMYTICRSVELLISLLAAGVGLKSHHSRAGAETGETGLGVKWEVTVWLAACLWSSKLGGIYFSDLDMFAEYCHQLRPPARENFTGWTSRLYRHKCFQIAEWKRLLCVYDQRGKQWRSLTHWDEGPYFQTFIILRYKLLVWSLKSKFDVDVEYIFWKALYF